MRVAKNTVVELTYVLKVNDDEGNKQLIEKVESDHPMTILVGMSGLPEKFESNIDGLEEGQNFTIEVKVDEAYGDYEDEAVVKLPKDVFMVDGKFEAENFEVGTMVPMTDQEGNMMRGRVIEVDTDALLMDFNHPLAGHDLFFEGKIESVRLATEEELDHGHVHGPGGHQH
jgi:FKBP-type peptidyl-prolyl cis-trans isomerase SlyD